MNKLRKTLFISDLHLDKNLPDITQLFFNFLNNLDHTVEALYILGDLFEVWIGDDENSAYQQTIMQALKKITETLPTYFIHGNRDFLIGKQFFEKTGVIPLVDETKIMLYGQEVLIMHGDTLCTHDINYLKARKILRHPLTQFCFLHLPLALRKKIAIKLRMKSMAYTQSIELLKLDAVQEEIERVMQKHQLTQLIHGHTHRPNIHHFTLNQQPACRMVLGAWHYEGSVLEWHENGEKQLISFK